MSRKEAESDFTARCIPEQSGKPWTGKKVYIYAQNDSPVVLPRPNTAWPGRLPIPEDVPNEAAVSMFEAVFPWLTGDELVRLEDHIRHNPRTRLCTCSEAEAPEILGKLRLCPANLRITSETGHGQENTDLLPQLHAGQWQICRRCLHFTLQDRLGTCSKRWCCKWGGSETRTWDVDSKPVCYHSQCPETARHIRFETALLFYTERFKDKISRSEEGKRLMAERQQLLRRDIMAAADAGDARRIRKRCTELGNSFKEFASRQDIFSRMLNYWCVNRRLLANVRILLEEGIDIPAPWHKELLRLPDADDAPGAGEEHRQLLHGQSPKRKNDRNAEGE